MKQKASLSVVNKTDLSSQWLALPYVTVLLAGAETLHVHKKKSQTKKTQSISSFNYLFKLLGCFKSHAAEVAVIKSVAEYTYRKRGPVKCRLCSLFYPVTQRTVAPSEFQTNSATIIKCLFSNNQGHCNAPFRSGTSRFPNKYDLFWFLRSAN